MKTENMNTLVSVLGKYMSEGDFMYSPKNPQYDWYLDIFIDEIKDGDCHHIDRFSEELATRLIREGLEPTANDGGIKTDQHKRYNEFYMAWYNWR